jgi:hypothetical protein
MRVSYQHIRSRSGSGRLAPAALAAGIGVAIMLSAGGEALAARASIVVPANGTVAGHGYGYWLQRSWQATFSATPPAVPCKSLTANGQHVGYLTLKTLAPGTDRYTCSAPAGRPMYVVGLSNECSTFTGDHSTFGTSDQQLKRCARGLFQGAKDTTTIDGHSVNVDRLIAGTGAYAVHVPKNNPFGLAPGRGRSAAHGFGLLLTGFAKGTHIIQMRWSIATSKWDITFTLHVH